jgi:hypothetical protein
MSFQVMFDFYRLRLIDRTNSSALQKKNRGVQEYLLWRTINLGRPVIELTSKCEAGIMFN